MEQLISFNFDTQTVSARELHEKLNIKKRFSEWFETNSQGFIENEDFTSVLKSTEVQNNGGIQLRQLQDYQLSIDMAKHICLMSRTERGKLCRQYLIDLEKAWNTPEQVMARALKLADKTIDSLKAENVQLLEDNKRMQPKEIFADAVSGSKSSILIRELAKLIKQNDVDMGERRLYKWLRANGYICKDSTEPTQRAMEMGLFERVIRTIDRGDDLPIEKSTTKVTGKGQIYFVNKFLAEKKTAVVTC